MPNHELELYRDIASSTADVHLDMAQGEAVVSFVGDWRMGQSVPVFTDLSVKLNSSGIRGKVTCSFTALTNWDSVFMAYLLHLRQYCDERGLVMDVGGLPEGAEQLFSLATAVPPHREPSGTRLPPWHVLDPRKWLSGIWKNLLDFLIFIGEVMLALGRLVRGRANIRTVDLIDFCYQAGPGAFAIITLTSVLVGMILAYLGSVQLQQFGAQIYVANLVIIGMLREMGALMTAVVMAGRTGAAYAAQLGTMQTNEEIDALTTLGVSTFDFLVLPRMVALVCIMPLLVIYSDLLGVLGGAIVSLSMDVTFIQFVNQARDALAVKHIAVGLIKSVVFAVLIAVAGCRAGMRSGRSSAAVGQAATTAVVTAVVYLIVADAAINIIFQRMGI